VPPRRRHRQRPSREGEDSRRAETWESSRLVSTRRLVSTKSRDQARISPGDKLDQLAGMRRISDGPREANVSSDVRLTPQAAAISAACSNVTVALLGSVGRSNRPGSSSHSWHPAVIAWATSGQRMRASRYGSVLSGSTTYRTSCGPGISRFPAIPRDNDARAGRYVPPLTTERPIPRTSLPGPRRRGTRPVRWRGRLSRPRGQRSADPATGCGYGCGHSDMTASADRRERAWGNERSG
jgi:hypothetical protein